MIDITSRTPDCKIRAYDTGEIHISASLARRMKLCDGDRVQILMHRNNGYDELYIAKGDGASGIIARGNSRRGSSLRIYSKKASSVLLRGHGKGIFRIGESIQKDDKELHTIIYCKNYAERKEIHTIQGDHQATI